MRIALLNGCTLFILIVATMLNLYWVWGALFCFWTVSAFKNGSTFLLTTIAQSNSPTLFWMVSLMWLIFGIWYLVYDLLWRFGINSIFGYNLYSNL